MFEQANGNTGSPSNNPPGHEAGRLATPEAVPEAAGGRGRRSAGLALRLLLVRLRFPALLAALLLLVGSWPTVRGY